jgi:hypothetical protein
VRRGHCHDGERRRAALGGDAMRLVQQFDVASLPVEQKQFVRGFRVGAPQFEQIAAEAELARTESWGTTFTLLQASARIPW